MATIDPSKVFLGVGWHFPVAAGDEEVALVGYEEDVRQAILIILQTQRGERVMRPEFGAGLREFVFEPANPATMALIKKRVEDALIDWEPRIDVLSVSVTISEERNRLAIDVAYRVRATNSAANVVFPFYLLEGSAP
ncbi:GPW/gp25 family protein [Sorangium sp. So ce429]